MGFGPELIKTTPLMGFSRPIAGLFLAFSLAISSDTFVSIRILLTWQFPSKNLSNTKFRRRIFATAIFSLPANRTRDNRPISSPNSASLSLALRERGNKVSGKPEREWQQNSQEFVRKFSERPPNGYSERNGNPC